MPTVLLTFEAAARELNVPVASLRSSADAHGLTIRMGRAIRIHPDDLRRLIDLCRAEPKAPDYSGAKTENTGKSEIPKTENGSGLRPAQAAANKLKTRLQTTSAKSTAQLVAPLKPRT